MKKLIAFLFFFFSFYSHSEQLSCGQIYYIQNQFLKSHILYDKLTKTLKTRTLNQFIKNLDREKVYFLTSDIEEINRRNRRLFRDLKQKKCNGLYYIYDIYSRRVKERMAFAEGYLGKGFSFDKKLTYITDEDLKQHPTDTKSANLRMTSYIQYHVANVFLFEKDLKKSVEQVSYILNNFYKQVRSWKPQLNHKDRRECKRKKQEQLHGLQANQVVFQLS